MRVPTAIASLAMIFAPSWEPLLTPTRTPSENASLEGSLCRAARSAERRGFVTSAFGCTAPACKTVSMQRRPFSRV